MLFPAQTSPRASPWTAGNGHVARKPVTWRADVRLANGPVHARGSAAGSIDLARSSKILYIAF
jgi:hypothetical protein